MRSLAFYLGRNRDRRVRCFSEEKMREDSMHGLRDTEVSIKPKAGRMPRRGELRDGIRYYPPSILWPEGHEVCETPSAWSKRRNEVWFRALGRCECGCRRELNLNLPLIADNSFHVDHVRLRGMGGGSRNDALSNLRALSGLCHRKKHGQ